MAELDSPEHMPEGLDEHVWQKLVDARRVKVESEQRVCIEKRSHYFSLHFYTKPTRYCVPIHCDILYQPL